MTKAELIKELAATRGKTKAAKLSKLLKRQGFVLRDLIDLTFHEDKTIAFRAAWLLENLLLVNPMFYFPEIEYLLMRFKDVKYPSCQRHYAKIMMYLTSPKVHPLIKAKLADTELEPVVEQCFEWLIDPKVLIAVKVFAAETLFNLCPHYLWIAEELKNQLEFLMRDGTAAIQSRGRKLLAALYNN
jgi:hypothetical protein